LTTLEMFGARLKWPTFSIFSWEKSTHFKPLCYSYRLCAHVVTRFAYNSVDSGEAKLLLFSALGTITEKLEAY
jgi:hypothetical protein